MQPGSMGPGPSGLPRTPSARSLSYHRRARLEAAIGRALEEVDGQIEDACIDDLLALVDEAEALASDPRAGI